MMRSTRFYGLRGELLGETDVPEDVRVVKHGGSLFIRDTPELFTQAATVLHLHDLGPVVPRRAVSGVVLRGGLLALAMADVVVPRLRAAVDRALAEAAARGAAAPGQPPSPAGRGGVPEGPGATRKGSLGGT